MTTRLSPVRRLLVGEQKNLSGVYDLRDPRHEALVIQCVAKQHANDWPSAD
jgi:hypothetical protein